MRGCGPLCGDGESCNYDLFLWKCRRRNAEVEMPHGEEGKIRYCPVCGSQC